MMKTLSVALILIVLTFSPMLPLVSAQSNNNLHWGVNVGDEIPLVLQRKVVDPSYAQYFVQYAPFIMNISEGQRLTANVTYLSPIPSYINSSEQIPHSNCTLIRDNDSTVIAKDFTMVVVPAGDYDFMTRVGNFTAFQGTTVINTTEEWGTIMEGSFTMLLVFTVNFHIEMRYEKANGTLNMMRAKVDLNGNSIIDIILAKWKPGMTTILPPENQSLVIEIAVIVGIGCVAVTYLAWRRHKHGLLPEAPASP